MKKCLLIILLYFFTCISSNASKVYEFTSLCQQAYKEITQLKLNSGAVLIQKAKQENPNNLIPFVLDSYIDFFILFLNEDPAEYKIRKPNFEDRISLLKEGPESSPFYSFCLCAVYAHKTAVAIRFGELWTAAWDGKRAYQYIKENNKKFPSFTPNNLLLGGLQAVIGTIPKSFKWIANLFGFRGSITEGMNTVRSFVYSNDPWSKLMANEAAFSYCYLQFYIENKKDAALQFIQTKKLDLVNNHLFAYMAANLSINNKQPEYAKQVILNRNKSSEYFQTPVWDYEMGLVKIYHLETQESLQYFERFLATYKGKYYVKEIYQKISWIYFLQGNMPLAEAARKNVFKKGSTDSDADKQALRDGQKGKWPNVLLLKSRLLNDGGYNKDAIAILKDKSLESFDKTEEQLEFVYRLARINDDLGNDTIAIDNYLKAIQIGQNRTEYYAARAAFQIGMIYEKKGDRKKAIEFFNRCLDMDDHDYKLSLDQRAKSGIARCKGE